MTADEGSPAASPTTPPTCTARRWPLDSYETERLPGDPYVAFGRRSLQRRPGACGVGRSGNAGRN
ncbi:MAG: hypothetical protein J2P57_24020, partial [Acidimicrobiaceae bacterium]|nr:hypothetical protein [Acidimicrobiaceae bacterium]